MICAEDEIGLGESHEGIIVLNREYEPGTPANVVFPVFSDVLYEIGLTPNRGDAASHLGIARELRTWFKVHEKKDFHLSIPNVSELPVPSGSLQIGIEILNPEACLRYAGIIINGVKFSELPPLMNFRLKACGYNTIHPVVDITNYVMLETGQPLHAFDYEKIKGKKIIVGMPEQTIPFHLLDGREIELTTQDLVIGNEEEPMCLAGIYGGKESGIRQDTKVIFLESAVFNPGIIRKSSARHRLKTESSFRFERGVDPEGVLPALQRAAGLILQHCGGTISWGPEMIQPVQRNPVKIAFSFSYCNELLGQEIPPDRIVHMLESMDVKIEAAGKDGALCEIPGYKNDVTRPVDLVEEIARVYGYDNIKPSGKMNFTPTPEKDSYRTTVQEQLQGFLIHRGFQEAAGLSLEKFSWHSRHPERAVRLLNPVSSDSAFLRPNLYLGGLQILSHNIRRQHRDLRFFEWGEIYKMEKDGKITEQDVLGFYTSGRIFRMNHYHLDFTTGLSDHLAVIYAMANQAGKKVRAEEFEDDFISGVRLLSEDIEVGYSGYPKMEWKDMFDIEKQIPVCLSQLFYLRLFDDRKKEIFYKEPSSFPFVRRDLSFVLDKNIRFGNIENTLVQNIKDNRLKEITLFDIYEGKNIGEGKKSVALSFKFQSDTETLREEEVNELMKKIAEVLQKEFKAEIRS